MIKALPWILFGLALVAALYAFALVLNAGGSLDDSRTETARLRERNNIALSIVRKEWVGKDAASVVDLSKELQRKGIMVKRTRDGAFEIGDLIFETKDGVVTQVHYFD